MLIAIEGPDGSGKSTLIGNLKKSLKGNVLYLSRTGRLETRLELVIFHGMINAIYETGLYRHIILDRHPWISEYVYGRVLRDGGILGDYGLEELQKIVSDVTFIYCDASIEAIRKTSRREEQMKGVAENLEDLHDCYQQVMDVIKPKFSYDFEVTPTYFELNKISEALNND